jgi:hypothetical protein
MKVIGKDAFSLEAGMILFYDKRSRAFLAGLNRMDTFYWHNGKNSADDKAVFEKELSFNDAMAIAQIAANVAGLEVTTEDADYLIIFQLRKPQ